jgi:hypothetical protein
VNAASDGDHKAMITAAKSDVADLAALLARGFLRLNRTAPERAVFPTQEPHVVLDVVAQESPHDRAHGRS